MDQDDLGVAQSRANRWYLAAKIFAAMFTLSATLVIALMVILPPPAPREVIVYIPTEDTGANGHEDTAPMVASPRAAEITSDISLALLISLGAFFVTGAGTASTVILGWRKERRETAEFRLKIEQLELQLAQARQAQPKTAEPG